MIDDFSRCMVSNSRMAARAITRRYEKCLRGFGMTATQLSLMGALAMTPGRTITELADDRGFERTTLTRNLDLLEKQGLVASKPATRGNGRICAITAEGELLIAQLLPAWRTAQAEMKQLLSEQGFDDALATLKRLARV